jgi:hypothetical protein
MSAQEHQPFSPAEFRGAMRNVPETVSMRTTPSGRVSPMAYGTNW